MDDLRLKLVLEATDKMTTVLTGVTKNADKNFTKISDNLTKIGDKFQDIGKKSMLTGGAITAFSAVQIKSAADFESQMTNVSTLLDTNKENIKDIGNEVMKIAQRTPVAMNDLTNSLYNIRSAGIEAKDQFSVLEKSAQLSVAGLSSVDEAVDISTSALNAFGLQGKEAEKIYDNIFKTVKYGKTTVSGVAQGFGSVAGTVAAANIKVDEYLAAIAAMTTTGQPAAQAHTQIKAAISDMTRESKESVQVFNALGAKSFKDLVQKSGGMVNAFARIVRQVKGNDAAILKLFGSTEAYNAVVSLTGKQLSTFKVALDDMRNGSDALEEAYSKKLKNINSQMQIVKNSTQNLSIQYGNALLPAVTKVSNALIKTCNAIDLIPDKLKSVIAITTTAIGVGLAGFGMASFAIGTMTKSIAPAIVRFNELKFLYSSIGKNSYKIFDFVGMKGTAFGLKEIIKMKKEFGNLGQSSFMPLLEIASSDASIMRKQIWNNIITPFRTIPKKVDLARQSIVSFIKNAPANAVTGFKNGLSAIQMGFINFVPNCRKAAQTFKLFSSAILFNPVGWAITTIAAGAFLIYKYWKPITAFFKGTFRGIKEGLAPLEPVFTQIGNAFKPLVDWIKKFFTPINTNGERAANWGYQFGKSIANVTMKVIEAVKWVKNLLTLGGRINFGNSGITLTEVNKPDGSHANGLTRVPYDGYIAEVHKDESILSKKEADDWRKYKQGNNNANNTTINYSPNITISGEDKELTNKLLAILKNHGKELANIVISVQKRKEAGAYA